MHEFAETYGKAVVVQEDRGASVSVIVTISQVSNQNMEKINDGMSAHGGFGPLTASAKLAFENETQQASKEGRLDVQVVSTGGEGFGKLHGVVTDALGGNNSFEECTKAIGDYVAQFTMANAAPIGYHVQSMTAFGWIPTHDDEDISTDLKQRKLFHIVDEYRARTNESDQIDGILKGTDPRVKLISPDRMPAVEAAPKEYEHYLEQLSVIYQACKADRSPTATGCDIPDNLSPPPAVLPPLPPVCTGSWRYFKPEPSSGPPFFDAATSWNILRSFFFSDSPSPLSYPANDVYYTYVVLEPANWVSEAKLFFEATEVCSFTTLPAADIEHLDESYDRIQLKTDKELDFAGFMKREYDAGKSGNGVFTIRTQDAFGRNAKVPILKGAWTTGSSFAITQYSRINGDGDMLPPIHD
jgi:hypothetical protein